MIEPTDRVCKLIILTFSQNSHKGECYFQSICLFLAGHLLNSRSFAIRPFYSAICAPLMRVETGKHALFNLQTRSMRSILRTQNIRHLCRSMTCRGASLRSCASRLENMQYSPYKPYQLVRSCASRKGPRRCLTLFSSDQKGQSPPEQRWAFAWFGPQKLPFIKHQQAFTSSKRMAIFRFYCSITCCVFL